jgi:aspartyl/asparaginyl beta-hydroxylase (cupin superfamily)
VRISLEIHIRAMTMTMKTIARSLRELHSTPDTFEYYKRLYLWKFYLKLRLMEHQEAVNMAMEEVLLLANSMSVPEAILTVIDPSYRKRLILHDYPEVVRDSIDYLLHGREEEIIPECHIRNAEKRTYQHVRIELNNVFYAM